MKILAAALATCLLASPALAQGDQGKPPAPPESATDAAPPADGPIDPAVAAAKPVDPATATPEPEEAPEGTEPVKPADTPTR